MTKRFFKRRPPCGIMAVEVAFGAFITVVVAGIAGDLTLLTLAYENLDKTARDCARAAGGQSTSALANSAAIAQLAAHKTDGYFCQQPQLVGNAVTIYQDWSGSPYNGTPPALGSTTQCAYVTVSCSEAVRLPLPIPFFKTNITNFVPGSVITFYRKYTFPIVKIKYTGG